MKKPSAKHRLEYLGYRIVTGLAWFLPERLAYWIGELLGWMAAVLLRVRRKDVDRHLRLAFPDESSRWRGRVARACYRHLGREWVATLRLMRMTAEEIVSRTSVSGLDPLLDAVKEGRGAVMLTGHVGNWEVGGAALAARGIPMEVVAFAQANPLVDRAWRDHRTRMGMSLLAKEEAVVGVLRTLREGRVAGILADQNARGAAIFVDYFGVPAATAKGPALFALRSGAPAFVGAAFRKSGIPQRYAVTVREIRIERSGVLETDVRRFTEAYTAAMEGFVRSNPEQNLWQHRRWKTRPVVAGEEEPVRWG